MRPTHNIKSVLVMALVASVTLSACKELNNNAQTLSEEDLEVVQSVIAESLSDKNDGLMTELYDIQANLNIGSLGKAVGGDFASQNPPPPWRGGSFNYSRTYDPETGTHTIQYQRSHVQGDFSKSITVFTQYIFTSPDGSFVEFPGREDVESISFNGTREGAITTPFRSSSFDREARWSASGLINGEFITLNGSQNNSGEMSLVNMRGDEISRSFTLSMNLSDVTIEKGIESADDLEDKVTGTITYTMDMTHTVNGEIREKSVEGSIELEGNGLALLRLMGSSSLFRVNLADGTVEKTGGPRR